jgi:large subunit ribosomal protein L35
MPKMKTNSSAKKRVSITGSGKIKRKKAFKNHILTKKATKRKRGLTQSGLSKRSGYAEHEIHVHYW